MMKGGWYRSLNIQLVALLTLALFPLGAIAMFQTNSVAVEAEKSVDAAILGLTERAARAEEVLIERAVGASRFLSSIAPELAQDQADCGDVLSRFVAENDDVSFVGIIGADGRALCVSSGALRDFSQTRAHSEVLRTLDPTITVDDAQIVAGNPTFVVTDPYVVSGALAGYVVVAVPHRQIPETSAQMIELGLVELVTFNDNGAILTARSDRETAVVELPEGLSLETVPVDYPMTFRGTNINGTERRYSVVTIEGTAAAVMAVWNADAGLSQQFGNRLAAMAFPALMWIAGVVVAMLAMNTLVLRHLRRIRQNMDRFSDSREIAPAVPASSWVPVEIEKLEGNFARMGREIMRDEAQLEDAVREKAVLVKEIHHRVKNNLQLIASIMNMKIRSAQELETKVALQSIQERVLSLATIHRDLYQTQDSGRVNAGALLEEIVERSIEMVDTAQARIAVTSEIAAVKLFPDQAVPLSLFVAEATTNAIKYMGNPETSKARLAVTLVQDADDCVLTIANTIAPSTESESTGMGAKLMSAFAQQIGGKIAVSMQEGCYVVRLDFRIRDFDAATQDY